MIIYGIGSSYVYDVDETLRRLGLGVTAYINNLPDIKNPVGLSPIVGLAEIQHAWLGLPVTIPLVTPGHRNKLFNETRQLGFSKYPALIDPTAIVASTSDFDEGGSVNAGVVIAAQCRFGKFVLINRSASIGHGSVIEDFGTLGPGALLCGLCRIKTGAFIGAGAIVSPEVTVGRNAIVGAGAVVIKDVPDNCIVVGNPAKIIRENNIGYNGVSV